MSAFAHDDILDLRTLADEMRNTIIDLGDGPSESMTQEDYDYVQAELTEWVTVAKAILESGPRTAEWIPAILADELESYGDNYGPTLIADSYFVEYAQQLADDIGALDDEPKWPHSCIDWAKAADELKSDYTMVTILGRDYWMRSA